MSKTAGRPQTRFVCQSCGEAFLRWEGQCRACQAWNSLVETAVRPEPRSARRPVASGVGGAVETRRLADVASRRPRSDRDRASSIASSAAGSCPVGRPRRRRAGDRQVDAPPPGRGRRRRGGRTERVLYATGEESASQVRLRPTARAPRGPAGGIRIAADPRVGPDRGRRPSRAVPALVVVDSIQTATVDELDGPPGSVGQVRRAPLRLMELAKADGIAVVLVGHVTKDGSIAGPKTPRALSSTPVLTLRASSDMARGPPPARDEEPVRARPKRSACSRWARAASARSPIRPGLPGRARRAGAGSVVAPTLEGSRPLARARARRFVAPGPCGTDREGRASGVDANRVSLLVAVPRPAGRDRTGEDHDVYVKPLGRRPDRRRARPRVFPLADRRRLASSLRESDRSRRHGRDRGGRPPRRAPARVTGLDRRLREAARPGFRRAIVPRRAARCRRHPTSGSRDRRGRRSCGMRSTPRELAVRSGPVAWQVASGPMLRFGGCGVFEGEGLDASRGTTRGTT
jgi:DNA repair protein RadA/Sms